MPAALLDAYVTMLPRVQAERQVVAAEIASVPHMKPDQRRRWFADRLAIADPGRRTRGASRPGSAAELARTAGMHGIGVRTWERPSRPSSADATSEPRDDHTSRTETPSGEGGEA